MQEDGSDRVLSKLEELERRLREAVVRLEAVEGRLDVPELPRLSTPQPPPPPQFQVQTPPPSPPRPQLIPQLQFPVSPPLRSADDTEFSVGAKVLPRVGAFLVLLGIGYLIGLGIKHGFLTPTMQFAGAVLLCLAFVAVGLYKLNEREEFGHLLVGIGSCGMYITFAGGHAYQHLYSDRVLIILFLLLSFANLGFCLFRSAQSFLGIGVLGGISAVLIPFDQNPAMLIPLHFLVVIPAVLIAAKNRWAGWMMLIWLVSLAPPLAYWSTNADWVNKIAFFYASSAFQIAVATLRYPGKRKSEPSVYTADFDPDGHAPAAAVVLTMLGGFGIKFDWAHLVVFAAALGIWVFLLPEHNPHRAKLAFVLPITLLVLAPATQTPERGSLVYSLEAILCAAVSLRPQLRLFAGVAYVLWGAALYAYLMSFVGPQSAELAILGVAVVSGVIVTAALRKAEYMPMEFTIVSSLIGLALVSRAAQLTLGSETWTLTLAWSLYATAMLFTGFGLKQRELRYLSLGIFGAAVLKVLMVDIAEVPQTYRVVVLLVLGVAMLAGGYWYIRTRKT